MTAETTHTATGDNGHDICRLAHEKAELQSKMRKIEHSIWVKVGAARRDGESWGTIGQWLGVSKQAAQQRYGHDF